MNPFSILAPKETKYYRAEVVHNGELVFVTNPFGYDLQINDVVSIDLSLRNLPIMSNPQNGFYLRVRITKL